MAGRKQLRQEDYILGHQYMLLTVAYCVYNVD